MRCIEVHACSEPLEGHSKSTVAVPMGMVIGDEAESPREALMNMKRGYFDDTSLRFWRTYRRFQELAEDTDYKDRVEIYNAQLNQTGLLFKRWFFTGELYGKGLSEFIRAMKGKMPQD
ncbi:MAG: hypothetical protein Q7S06_02810 [Nanoarchaeota archaeon]|nr:hypothetical protein [Nanoarchaeota archaeon]